MADKINSLDEAILNIGKSRDNTYGDPKTNDVLYSRWDKRHSRTIGDFYSDFIEPRLPDPEVVRQWHKVLMEYSQRKDAVFFIRDGHSDASDDKLKLRRGWLVRVNHGDSEKSFSYAFTDNHLATYIYKMALDGYCPTTDEFFDFMTKFKDPDDIGWLQGRKIKNDYYNGEKRHFISMPVHFGWIGKSSYPGNTESKKNAFINTTPAPTSPFGAHGYKHAHIFAVKDGKAGLYKFDGKEVEWKNIKLVELGEESNEQKDYQWDDSIKNYVWDRQIEDENKRDALREVVVAHFLKFLDPMNHFLTPKRGCNKFTTKNKDYSFDIAEYDILISHLIFIREKVFGEDFEKFEKAVLAADSFKGADNSDEDIDIVYHEDIKTAASQKRQKGLKKAVGERKAKKTIKKAGAAPSSAKSCISNRRDNNKYSFEGEGALPKGRVLLKMVTKYIETHPSDDVEKLKEIFNLELVFNNKPIILIESETTEYMRTKSKVEAITLADGITVIYVNKQVQIGDMDEIIRISHKLGFNIAKV